MVRCPYLIVDHPIRHEPSMRLVLNDVHIRRDKQALAVLTPPYNALGPLGIAEPRRRLERLGLRVARAALFICDRRLRHQGQSGAVGEDRTELHVLFFLLRRSELEC